MNRSEYEGMLEQIEVEIETYKSRLDKLQVNIKTEDDEVVIRQIGQVLVEIKSLKRYIKCALGEFIW